MSANLPKPRLLIVEDEEPIRRGLIDMFVFHGYSVDAAVDGKEALAKVRQEKYDLILLDVMLPHVDGFEVCNEIRKMSREQPIIMLTAKTSDEDIITGLSLGADDYVGKPFSITELLLRVEAVLRRARKLPKDLPQLELGTLLIDPLNLVGRNATGGQEISFTRREVEILQYLQAHRERPVSREELLSEVWGYAKNTTIETRTVDIHIAKLRRKIEVNAKTPQLLVTVRGEGYRLDC